MSIAPEVPSYEKVRAENKIRHEILETIMNTDDLAGLHTFVYEGLQRFGQFADQTQMNIMRREVFGKLLERLDRCITLFSPRDQGQQNDPLWLIEIIQNFDGDMDEAKFKKRIMSRLCDDILHITKDSVSETVDYFYKLSAELEISLDDEIIEGKIYQRAEMHFSRCETMGQLSPVMDFLTANLPVGRAYLRRPSEHGLQFVDFNGVHITCDI